MDLWGTHTHTHTHTGMAWIFAPLVSLPGYPEYLGQCVSHNILRMNERPHFSFLSNYCDESNFSYFDGRTV